MKILQIANKAIYPPDGGSLAILSFSQAYINNGHNVHLLNMLTHKHSNKISNIDSSLVNKLKIYSVKIHTKISIFKLLLNFIFSKTPYIAERFISKNFSKELESLIQTNNYDLIQIEGLYCLQYIHIINSSFKGKVVYRPHNLEYLIWQRNAQENKSFIHKYYFSILSKRLYNLEINLLNKYDYIAPISNIDEQYYKVLGNKKPIKTIPFGINTKLYSGNINKAVYNKDSVCYIGALDWIPNQNGLIWFIEKSLPIIIKDFPSFKLNIAGRNAPDWLIKKFTSPYIIYHGEVKNANEYLLNNGPMIVPLFSGSGMRVKIIEGMALKKPIVATKIAIEGINCTNGENIYISNDPETFAKSIIRLMNNLSIQNDLGENSFKFVKENFDNTKLAEDLINFIK